jgi:uncharacterized protein (TIGR03437 family)
MPLEHTFLARFEACLVPFLLAVSAFGAQVSGTPVQVTVNGLQAAVLYAGPAPGFAGLSQINAVIPQTSTGPGQVLIGTAPFNQPVRIWVK